MTLPPLAAVIKPDASRQSCSHICVTLGRRQPGREEGREEHDNCGAIGASEEGSHGGREEAYGEAPGVTARYQTGEEGREEEVSRAPVTCIWQASHLGRDGSLARWTRPTSDLRAASGLRRCGLHHKINSRRVQGLCR
jgi:hypothetical protein